MSRVGARLLVSLIALALLLAGLAGAYSYAQDYSHHRGFVTIAKLPRAGTGRLLNVNFRSRALRREAYYLAYLPPGYTSTRRYPVFYLLHGMPGRPQVWVDIANMDVRLDNQLIWGHLQPMILVFPDGRIGGSTYSDSEWANTRSGAYESYLLDVVRDVDRRFSTRANRGARVIAGFSAGAYGAVNVALHHLAVFGSAQSWSGYFTQTRSGVFAHATRAQLAYNSPIDYVGRLRAQLAADPLRVFMFVGRADGSSRQIVPMARALAAAGAQVRYAIYHGGHDWQVWYPQLNAMVVQASHDVSAPLQPLGGLPAPGVMRSKGAAHRSDRFSALARSRLRERSAIARSRLRERSAIARSRAQARSLLAQSQPRAPSAASAAHPTSAPSPWPQAAPPPARQHPRARRGLLAGLLLALLSAAAINLGFLLQHRGLAQIPDGERHPLVLLRSRAWLGGQVIGWIGFAAQIVAVALAPLSVVQAFAASGLALSVPLAAGVFRHSVSRTQLLAVLMIAAGLASLPIGLSSAHGAMRTGLLVSSALLAAAIAAVLGLRRSPSLRAIAGGLFYGVADAAIKADSVNLKAHGGGALLSAWTLLALLATFGGFLSFQVSLRAGNAVSAISVMTAVTALTALGFGLTAFGESLGVSPAAVIVHALAIALVLGCVPLLAGAQQELAHAGPRPSAARTPNRALRTAGTVVAFTVMLVLALLAGTGLLYALRGLHWFTFGAPIGDSLPLLQLAGFDSQPLLRVLVAWLPAGMIFAMALFRIGPLRRTVTAAVAGILLMLLASNASFALARNLTLGYVLVHRSPGLGAWVEGALFGIGCFLPALILWLRANLADHAPASWLAAPGRPVGRG